MLYTYYTTQVATKTTKVPIIYSMTPYTRVYNNVCLSVICLQQQFLKHFMYLKENTFWLSILLKSNIIYIRTHRRHINLQFVNKNREICLYQ